MGELKKVFRPELLSRIDEVIVFHKLTKDEIKTIVGLMMQRLRDQMGVRSGGLADRRGRGAARREGLRPDDGRAPAAPGVPALHRGSAGRLRARARGDTPGSTILVDKKRDAEDEVEIAIIPGAPPEEPEKVAVPPDEASGDNEDSGD
jgi:ATP-dependent Clp protease ATP-binding subunit ClpC